MSRKITRILLAALGLTFLLGGSAFAGEYCDGQAFAAPEHSTYGGGPRDNQGLFFRYEWMHLFTLRPEVTSIGLKGDTRVVATTTTIDPVTGEESPVFTVQENSYDTSFLRSSPDSANWWELGWIEDHCGWSFNAFTMRPQDQQVSLSHVDVVFSDPPTVGGLKHLDGFIDANLTIVAPLPVTYETMHVSNNARFWGAEWMYLYRTHPCKDCIWHLGLGARYMEFDEIFCIQAQGGVLDDSNWDTEAENHIVGPLAYVRFHKTLGCWTLSAESRFISGFNSQNIRQFGVLGSKITTDPNADPDEDNIVGTQGVPLGMTDTAFKHSRFFNEWSPGVEMRVSLDCSVTRDISLGFGWTGFWYSGIARPSNMIDYQVPYMGIDPRHNRQDIFVNGPSLRILANY